MTIYRLDSPPKAVLSSTGVAYLGMVPSASVDVSVASLDQSQPLPDSVISLASTYLQGYGHKCGTVSTWNSVEDEIEKDCSLRLIKFHTPHFVWGASIEITAKLAMTGNGRGGS